MSEAEKAALMLVSRLLEYPDKAWFSSLAGICGEASLLFEPAGYETVSAFCGKVMAQSEQVAREDYVRTFDHDPAGSLYLSWHRYGNDRSQGKAMAALNALYRAAGFEPMKGSLPDYLPRMLEFMAVCDDWAVETMLDGFGPEFEKLSRHLSEQKSPYAPLAAVALAPLKRDYPHLFKARNKPDPTIRPMAHPQAEEALFGQYGCRH